ncbi:MAG: hypothetical protein GY866_39120 [Proteobacteria bacterium]|nr:hypothetical protein [Pseudomonadota bacterium]
MSSPIFGARKKTAVSRRIEKRIFNPKTAVSHNFARRELAGQNALE